MASSGILDLNALGAAGGSNITINNNSQLYLSYGTTNSTYATGSITLTLNGEGNSISSVYGKGALRTAGFIYTWPGNIVLASNAVICPGTTLTLSGNISGPGQLIKDSSTTLNLAGTSNTWGGGTKIKSGTLNIGVGSGMSTGDLTFSQNSGVGGNPTVNISCPTQTIGNLSSVFTDTSVTRSHILAVGANTTLTINQSANTTFGRGTGLSLSSVISGGAGSYVIKTGTGKLTLNSPGSYFYGGLTINQGEICINPISTFTLGNGANNRCPLTLNGGGLSTTGIGTAVVCSLGVLNVTAGSTITLDATNAHSLRFASPGNISAVLNIAGWHGGYNGTTGAIGKIYVGTSTSLSGAQLSNIHFTDSLGNIVSAVQLSTGEVVPKISITETIAGYGPTMVGTSLTISVSYSTTTTFFTGNFKVQLSNNVGGFTDFTSNIIGTGTTSLSGTISATIPGTTPIGGYRVRVVNTAPYSIASNDNGSNILINGVTPVISHISAYTGLMPGTTVTITGLNFNSTLTNNLIYFGAVRTTPFAGSVNSLSVTVPDGATLSPIIVFDSSVKILAMADTAFVPVYDNSFFDTSSSPFNFANKVDYKIRIGPNIAAAGDLDGDGYSDLVTSNRGGNGAGGCISVLQNRRTGVDSFVMISGPALTLAFSAHATNVKIGDINNDGKPDIIVANGNNASSITIFRNTTDFTSALPRTMTFVRSDLSILSAPNTPSQATLVTLADFDKDGKLDIAVGTNGTNPSQLVVFHNNVISGGTITLSDFTLYSFNGDAIDPTGSLTGYNSTASALVTGDFDGDGNLDVAMLNENGPIGNGSVSVFRNTSSSGSISFDPQISIATGTYPADIQTADLNNDGATDIVITNAISNNLTVLQNNNSPGAISFSSSTMTLIAGGESGIGLADLDADGKVDMVITNDGGGNTVSVYRNMSTAGAAISFVSAASSLTLPTGIGPTAVNIADLDNDGYPDIITGNSGVNGTGGDSSISIIRNTPLPKIGSVSPANPAVCVNATITLTYSPTVSLGESGRWSSADTTIAKVDSVTGVVTGRSAGTVNILYTVTVTRGLLHRAATRLVTVNPLPVVSISGFTGVCQGSTITLSGSPTPGTWANGSGAVATVNASTGVVYGVAASGTEIITYTHTSALGCTNTDTQSVAIILPPYAGSVSGTTVFCNATGTTLSSNGDAGGSWSSTNISIASVNSASGYVTGVGAGNASIVYTVINGCGTNTANASVTVLPLPNAGVINGTPSVCVGAVTTLTNTIGGGTWNTSNAALATVPASSGIVTGISVGTPTISYTDSNSCGVARSFKIVTVNTIPATPSGITGTTTICFDAATTLHNAISGGTWMSGNTSLATVNSTSGAVYGVAAGSPTISYYLTNTCGNSLPATTALNIFSYPSVAITSASPPCVGYATNIIVTGTSGARMGYQVDSGSITDTILTGGTFTLPTGNISTTHYYTIHNVYIAGCNLIKDTTATVVPLIMQWVGGAPGNVSDWSTAANWSCNMVPALADNVTIPWPTTYSPVVAASTTVYANSLSILPGATVSIGTNATLNVKGTFTNKGNIYGSGKVKLSGTSVQHIAGTGAVNYLELNNANGAIIDSGAKVKILNTLTVTNGTLVTNDSLELESSDTAVAARIAAIPSGGAVSGNVKVMQYIQGGYRRYRFWAHPFSTSISLQQLQDDIDITGVGGATYGFTTTGSNSPSAFRYDPLTSNSSLPYDIGWKPFTDIRYSVTADTNMLNRYQGMRIFMRGAKGEGLGYYFTYTPSATTIGMTGPVNQGKQKITLQKGTSANQDYNMVGNPYPSPVDLGTVIYNAKQLGNIAGSAFYVWNPSLGASGFFQAIPISSMSPTSYDLQANVSFQVRANNNGDSINFTESNKTTGINSNLLKAQPEFVTLYVYDANYHPWDMLYLKFTDAAKDQEDNDFDARKLLGSDFCFYSLAADGQKLAIDARPYQAKKVIPLGVTSRYDQEFIIKAEGMAVPEGGRLYIHDKLLKKFVLLQQGTEYRFTISKDKATQGETRFELSMEPADVAAVSADNNLNVTLNPNPATDEVNIRFSSGGSENVSVRIMDISGVSVYSEQLGQLQSGNIKVPLSAFPSGIYMVELISGNQKVVQRLIRD